jgi:hypothetical protein
VSWSCEGLNDGPLSSMLFPWFLVPHLTPNHVVTDKLSAVFRLSCDIRLTPHNGCVRAYRNLIGGTFLVLF